MTAPGLLVSVRSAHEARSASEGGAAIVDVKEPDLGPLGMADPSVWRAVRAVVPEHVPVSVALGELREWADRPLPLAQAFDGISYRKLGLAGSGRGWADRWAELREAIGDGPAWIAVAYVDWRAAKAPDPDAVIAEAAAAGCAGVLIDTFGKGPTAPRIDCSWRERIDRIRRGVGLAVVAGGLTADAIRDLRPLAPDFFAVRGAACRGGDRRAMIERDRVAGLAGVCCGDPFGLGGDACGSTCEESSPDDGSGSP